jgi:ubiquinone/menaquinone biosynthesis C-methylase UbiE
MDSDSVSAGFRNVDDSGEADFFIDYLKFVDTVPEFRSIKERSYIALGLKTGDTVLDAGCGIGLDSYRIGSIVGDAGKVVGFDSSESMLSIARKNIPAGLRNTSFIQGNLIDPNLPDATFDAVYVERVLQISPDPKAIIQQLVRVVKPGGSIVSVEPDWGTMALDPGVRDSIRSLIAYCTDSFPDGWTGRKLFRYFREAGMNVRIEAEPVISSDYPLINRVMNFENFISGAVQAGKISHDDAEYLVKTFRRADAEGLFFFSYVVYRVIAKKP